MSKLKNLIFIILFLISKNVFASSFIVSSLNGTSSIPLMYFCEEVNKIKENNIDNNENTFDVRFFNNLEELVLSFHKNEVDFLITPISLAYKLCEQSNFSYSCLAVAEKSSFFLLSLNSSKKNYSDLLGKTVTVSNMNNLSTKLFEWILIQNNIPINSSGSGVNISALNSMDMLISSLTTRKVHYSILSEPEASIVMNKNKYLYKCFDLQKEYSLIKGEDYYFPINVVLVKNSLLDDQVINEFIQNYTNAINAFYLEPKKIEKLKNKYNVGYLPYNISYIITNCNFELITNDYKNKVIDSLQIISKEKKEDLQRMFQ